MSKSSNLEVNEMEELNITRFKSTVEGGTLEICYKTEVLVSV